jgi:hypothetical protein
VIEQTTLLNYLAPGISGTTRPSQSGISTEEDFYREEISVIDRALLEPRRMQGVEQPEVLEARRRRSIRLEGSTDLAVFAKRGNEVVINKHGAFIPTSLWGVNANVHYEINRGPDGRPSVTLFSGERLPASRILPEIVDPQERARILRTVAQNMRDNPLPTGAPRFTRDELHERS